MKKLQVSQNVTRILFNILTLVALSAAAQANPTVGEKYHIDRHTPQHFDTRTMTLLRYQQHDLSVEELYRTSQIVASHENAFWVKRGKHAAKLHNLTGMTQNGNNYPPNVLDHIKIMKEKEKTRVYSWQDSDKLSAKQKKQLFDFLLGYNTGPNGDRKGTLAAKWPSSLEALSSGGVNYISVFRKGYLPDTRGYQLKRDDKKTQAQVQQFLRDMAGSYKLDRLTLVQDIEVQYHRSGKITIDRQRWPFPGSGMRAFSEADKDNQYILYPLPLPSAWGANNCTTVGEAEACGTYATYFIGAAQRTAQLATDRAIYSNGDITLPGAVTRLMNNKVTQQKVRMEKGQGWRMVAEFLNPELRITASLVKKQDIENHRLHVNIARVLILAPDDTVVWVGEAGQLPTAREMAQVENGHAARQAHNFAVTVNMRDHNQIVQGQLYHLLLAKFAPERLDDKMTDVILSSRWSYERSNKDPLGGRFFNTRAPMPSYDTIKLVRPGFKDWLLSTVKKMPDKYTLTMPLRYLNNKVEPVLHCIRTTQPSGVVVRKSTHRIQADIRRQISQCENANIRAKSKVDNWQPSGKCKRYFIQLQRSQKKLTEYEQKNCGLSPSSGTAGSTTTSSSTENPCDFPPDLSMANMQQEVQKCIIKNCGAIPTTTEQVPAYQQCTQQINKAIRNQMSAAMGFPKPRKKKQSNSSSGNKDMCRYYRDRIVKFEGKLEHGGCNEGRPRYEPADCQALAQAPLSPDNMPINRLEFRKSCSAIATTILPKQPYSYQHFDMALSFSDLQIPYDLPIPVQTGPMGARVNATLTLKITGIDDSTNNPSRLGLNAQVLKLDYAKP